VGLYTNSAAGKKDPWFCWPEGRKTILTGLGWGPGEKTSRLESGKTRDAEKLTEKFPRAGEGKTFEGKRGGGVAEGKVAQQRTPETKKNAAQLHEKVRTLKQSP